MGELYVDEDEAEGVMLGPLLSASAAEAAPAVGVAISEQAVEEAEAMLMRGSSPPSMRTAFWRLMRRARAAPTEVAEEEALLELAVVEPDGGPPGGEGAPPGGEGALPATPETTGATGPGAAGTPAGGATDPAAAAAALAAPAAVPGTCPASEVAALAAPAAMPGAAAAIPPATLKAPPRGVPAPAAEAALTPSLMADWTFC